MKEKILRLVLLLALLAVIAQKLGDGVFFRTVEVEQLGESRTESATESATTEYQEEKKSTVQEDAALILTYSTTDFFCGYPVEEGFFSWIAAQYGEETLRSLAEQLSAGNQDTELWYQLTGSSMHVLWVEYARAHGFASYLYENVTWKEAADPGCIKLDFVGDVNFADDWYTMQTAGSADGVTDCISESVQKELQSADVTMVNNEFTYTTSTKAQAGKDYCFKADPQNVSLLDVFGADIVSVANNHVFDFGKKGFLQTLATLRGYGTVVSGGGENLDEASAIQYFIVGGRKIAIVSATEIERFAHYTKAAGADSAGVLKTQQEEVLESTIQAAEKSSDYVIAYLHWGDEGKIYFGSDQTKLAKLCAKAGADAVIGGHPHRLQGVSFVEDVPVAYSLGNFWFSTGTLYTAIAQVQIDSKGKLSLAMLPCIQKGVKTSLCESKKEKKAFYHYLADVSSDVGIDEDGRIHPYEDVSSPGVSPYAYTSGRRYGMHPADTDLDGNSIDIVGNLL